MTDPMIYHLIWTCYGQWLQGDDRGYVDDEHNVPGTNYSPGNPQFRAASANRMTEPPVWLDDPMRIVAVEALREACRFRKWDCCELNVQPDHVHIVIIADESRGVEARRKLKSRGSAALNNAFGVRRHWWSDGGKVEVVRDRWHLHAVMNYVRNQKFPPPRMRE
ncbi:MAG: hypothetical protein BIFFINMI_01282 [Phycisphaerae bacterium]|nr:hypothetical protein [Phycisphaerae bacterium]